MVQLITEEIKQILPLFPVKTFKNIFEAQDYYRGKHLSAVYAFYADGKIYLGSTKNLKTRISKHLSEYRVHFGSQPWLHDLFDEAGIKNVQLFIFKEDYTGIYLDKNVIEGKLNTKGRLLEIALMQRMKNLGLDLISTDCYFNREPVTIKFQKPVRQYSLQGDFLKKYNSLTEAQEKTGVDLSSIIKVCNKQLNKAGGYVWKRGRTK